MARAADAELDNEKGGTDRGAAR